MTRLIPFPQLLLLVIVLGMMSLGCARKVEKPAPEPGEPVEIPAVTEPVEVPAVTEPVAPEIVSERSYRVDPAATDLSILVYRGGSLARLGHNHVISSKDVQGTVVLRRPIAASRMRLKIPVSTLIVDDPQLRTQAGPGFDTKLSEADIEGTRRNMLSERVLDAGPYPALTVSATVAGGQLPGLELDVEITIRDVTQRLRASAKVVESADTVVASGEFRLRQTDFGIKPYSVLAGALKVKDEIKVQYRVLARATN